jgi:hypothetical protein
MRVLNIILLVAVMLFGATHACGQDIEAFRKALSVSDALSGASVRVSEYGSASDIIYNYDSVKRRTSVQGYRVRIFFDNSQTARNDSAAVQAMFEEQYPSIPTYRVYESPSWIVAVGNCVTVEEALALQNRVKESFDIAFLWQGEIPLAELLKGGLVLPDIEVPDAGEDGEATGLPTDEAEMPLDSDKF